MRMPQQQQQLIYGEIEYFYFLEQRDAAVDDATCRPGFFGQSEIPLKKNWSVRKLRAPLSLTQGALGKYENMRKRRIR